MIMNRNEAKKLLYKQNPIARVVGKNELTKDYSAIVEVDGDREIIVFIVPLLEMTNGEFKDSIEAKLLARWIK